MDIVHSRATGTQTPRTYLGSEFHEYSSSSWREGFDGDTKQFFDKALASLRESAAYGLHDNQSEENSRLVAAAMKTLESVDWSSLFDSSSFDGSWFDAVADEVTSTAVEEVAAWLTRVPVAQAARITNFVGIVQLIFSSPEAGEGPERTWLSPAETRELLSRPGLGLGHILEPQPQGPELRNAP
jgi:hypothetical protein